MQSPLADQVDTLIVAILVLFIGNFLTRRVRLLEKNSIPQAVTGGLPCNIAILVIQQFAGPRTVFTMNPRDMVLLAFFTTIGLSAKFARLKSGGRPLGILILCAAAFLVLQNGSGISDGYARRPPQRHHHQVLPRPRNHAAGDPGLESGKSHTPDPAIGGQEFQLTLAATSPESPGKGPGSPRRHASQGPDCCYPRS